MVFTFEKLMKCKNRFYKMADYPSI